jgi:hypothetical protein
MDLIEELSTSNILEHNEQILLALHDSHHLDDILVREVLHDGHLVEEGPPAVFLLLHGLDRHPYLETSSDAREVSWESRRHDSWMDARMDMWIDG